MLSDVTVILGDPRLPDLTKPGQSYTAEDLDAVERMKTALSQIPGIRFSYLDDHEHLLSHLSQRPPAFVLNLCDTGLRNDAGKELHIPALLDMLNVPYTGAGPVCLGLCFDKALVRAVAQAHGLPIPREIFIEPGDRLADLSPLFPALIKPNRGDGSVGITKESVVRNVHEAEARLEQLRRELPNRDFLVQEFLAGTEYEVALIGNPETGFLSLPPMEVDYSALGAGLPHILAYESKVDPSSPYWTRIKYHPAQIDGEQYARLQRSAMLLFARLGCRDYARFDFRTDAKGEIKLLEVNPNPAWCWDGKLNFMAEFAGYSYADLLKLILETAEKRISAGRMAHSA